MNEIKSSSLLINSNVISPFGLRYTECSAIAKAQRLNAKFEGKYNFFPAEHNTRPGEYVVMRYNAETDTYIDNWSKMLDEGEYSLFAIRSFKPSVEMGNFHSLEDAAVAVETKDLVNKWPEGYEAILINNNGTQVFMYSDNWEEIK